MKPLRKRSTQTMPKCAPKYEKIYEKSTRTGSYHFFLNQCFTYFSPLYHFRIRWFCVVLLRFRFCTVNNLQKCIQTPFQIFSACANQSINRFPGMLWFTVSPWGLYRTCFCTSIQSLQKYTNLPTGLSSPSYR